MRDFRTIEIDLDLHRLIEAARESFSETPNDILRRLHNLPAAITQKASTVGPSLEIPGIGAWSGKGATLPAGTDLRMVYNGETFIAVIDNGKWLVNGERHTSPSGAASSVARTREGHRTNLDGWDYWHYRIPGTDEWRPLSNLRRAKK